MNGNHANKRLALLLGLAMGDALGVPVEFKPRGSFRVTGVQGYGTHNQPPGTWSDDTSLTLATAESLSRGYDVSDMAQNFVRWHDAAAFTPYGKVFDIGMATAKAIRRLKNGIAPEDPGGKEARANGTGSLMSIAPVIRGRTGKLQDARARSA